MRKPATSIPAQLGLHALLPMSRCNRSRLFYWWYLWCTLILKLVIAQVPVTEPRQINFGSSDKGKEIIRAAKCVTLLIRRSPSE
jgi:hypothetical protein